MGREVLVCVDGTWGYSDGQVIADIFDQKIHWPSGQKSDLIPDGRGGFEVLLCGVKHTAELMPGMRIKWSNGDIWTQLSYFGEQPNPVQTSPEFSEKNRNHPTQLSSFGKQPGPGQTSQVSDTITNREYSRVPGQTVQRFPRPYKVSCEHFPRPESIHTHTAPRPRNSCDDCLECNRKTHQFASPPMQLHALPPPEHVNFGQYQSYAIEHEVRYDLPPVRKIVHHLPEAHIVEHCYEPDCMAHGYGAELEHTGQPLKQVNQSQYHENSYSTLYHETRHDLPPSKTVLHHLPQHHEYEHCYDHMLPK